MSSSRVFRIACEKSDIKRLIAIKLRDEGLGGEKWITVLPYTCLSKWQGKKFFFSALQRQGHWAVNHVTEEQVKELELPYHKGKSLSAFKVTGHSGIPTTDWSTYEQYVDQIVQELNEG